MKFGICHLSIVPCRIEPSDESEMISQLLFGEHYKVIDERAKWVKVRNAWDGYEGWVDRKQFLEINKTKYQEYDKGKSFGCAMDLVSIIKSETSDVGLQPIVIGSSLPQLNDKNTIEIAEDEFQYEGLIFNKSSKDKARIVENAYMYLNAPYLWGGRSPFGIDCSGFSQILYKLSGFKLPRDAYQQAEVGLTLSFVEEAEPGDLAFFDNDEGKIIHVGVLLADNYIIHASGKVRIDRIDHQGIYNMQTKSYTHKLRLIKRIF